MAVAVALTVALLPRPAAAAPTARLAAMPASGSAPLVVGFDTTHSSAGTIAEHLVLTGNGDASSLAMAAQTTNYNYTLPGFYLAQTWLRDETGIALSAPVPISVSRERDGQAPPTASVTVAATTDPLTFAFMATVTAQPNDPIAAQLWDFGDGQTAGDAAPFHVYAAGGVYQAALVATTRAGLPLYGRVVVVVNDPGSGALPPSLLVTASPEDTSLLTPVTVTAYLEGVAPDAKLTSASVAWPDLVDASPTVTPTTSGITVTSQHAIASPGYYQVPVTVQLDGQAMPISATVPVTVGNIDDSAPSPGVLLPPSAVATEGQPYAPGGAGPTAAALLVAGEGPFAFGAAMPSPSNFAVGADGTVTWTPTHAQVGPQRLAVRIVDAQGNDAVRSWVVDVAAAGKGGCQMATGSGGAPSSLPALGLVALLLVLRRRGRRARAIRSLWPSW